MCAEHSTTLRLVNFIFSIHYVIFIPNFDFHEILPHFYLSGLKLSFLVWSHICLGLLGFFSCSSWFLLLKFYSHIVALPHIVIYQIDWLSPLKFRVGCVSNSLLMSILLILPFFVTPKPLLTYVLFHSLLPIFLDLIQQLRLTNKCENRSINAVSYTHLDVYKRQVHPVFTHMYSSDLRLIIVFSFS